MPEFATSPLLAWRPDLPSTCRVCQPQLIRTFPKELYNRPQASLQKIPVGRKTEA